jgi:hypothetical protein
MSRGWLLVVVLTCTLTVSLIPAGCVTTGEGQAGVTVGVGGKGSPGAPQGRMVQPGGTGGGREFFEDQ